MNEACKNGDIEIVKDLIDSGADNWNTGLRGACEGGHMNIVKLMIDKGARDWNDGLYFACYYGHIEIANLMIDSGANTWKQGLAMASCANHFEVVKFLIEKTKQLGRPFEPVDFENILINATKEISIDILILFIEQGAKDFEYRDLVRFEKAKKLTT